jgi:hypothetical protein
MKKWLYFLLDDQGRSYKVNNGNVQKVAQPTPLPNTPDGWQDISLGWERNMNRFGIIRSFSLSLGFVKAANYILRHISLTGTVESKAFLLIKNLTMDFTVSTYRFIYRFFYKGELDLTTVDLQDEKSNVSIMEGGLSKLLAANESNTYEFDLADDPEAVDILMNGMVLRNTYNFRAIPMAVDIDDPFVWPLGEISRDANNLPGVMVKNSYYKNFPVVLGGTSGTTEAFITYEGNGLGNVKPIKRLRVAGSVKFNNNGGGSVSLTFQLRGVSGTAILPFATGSYAPGQHEEDFDSTFTGTILERDTQMYLTCSGTGPFDNLEVLVSDIVVELDYQYADTVIKAYTLPVAYRKLIGRVAEGEQYAQSDFLDNYNKIVITSGDALRLIENAKLKTTLKDYFDSVNAWLNIGIGIDNKKIRLEEKAHFFPSSGTSFHLGKAKNLKVSFTSDLMFNKLKTGYRPQEYGEYFGKFEFNNTSEFTTPVTKVVKEFNLISPYRADPTGVEVTRINYEGKTTTDASSDNEVFALVIDYANPNIDGSYNLLRPTYSTLEGIPTETQSTIFNIDTFTPKRILKAHENWFRGVFNGFEDKRIIFQTTQKNRELRTIESGVVVDEDLNELIGNMASPLFKPYYFEFECESPVGIVDQLDDNPNVLFSFEWEGETYTGFLIKAGIAPDSNKEQTIKLLSSPSNDITQFI